MIFLIFFIPRTFHGSYDRDRKWQIFLQELQKPCLIIRFFSMRGAGFEPRILTLGVW